jgi:energy-coupling factor transport system permease protein
MPTILGELTGFEAKNNVYMKLQPVIKMLIPLFFSLDVLLIKNIYSALILVLLVFVTLLIAGVPLRILKGFLILITSISIFIVLSFILFTTVPGNKLFEYTLLQINAEKGTLVWKISITDSALIKAGMFIFRILAMIFTATLFVATVSDRDIVWGLRDLHLPLGFSVAVSLFFRGISLFLEDFKVIREAMMSRGVDFEKTSLSKKFMLYVNALIPLVSLMINRSYEVSLALESKGISPWTKSKRHRKLAFRRVDLAVFVLGFAQLLIFGVI